MGMVRRLDRANFLVYHLAELEGPETHESESTVLTRWIHYSFLIKGQQQRQAKKQ